MPTSDYDPLPYIGSIVPSETGLRQIPYLATSVNFSNGGSLVPITLYKRVGYSTLPVRHTTHVLTWGAGNVSIEGIFQSKENAQEVMRNLHGAVIREVRFTMAPAGDADKAVVYYCRHVIPNTLNLKPTIVGAPNKGINVMTGVLSMMVGHIITADHPRFITTNYDMPMTS